MRTPRRREDQSGGRPSSPARRAAVDYIRVSRVFFYETEMSRKRHDRSSPPFAQAGSGARLAHRHLTPTELDVLASAKNGRRICGCPDRACCPHGYKSMIEDPRAHTARQLFRTIGDLEAVPDLRRETYFIDGQLGEADQKARAVRALRPDPSAAARHKLNVENLMKRLDDHSRKVEKVRATLENLHETRGPDAPRACVSELRSAGTTKSSKRQP